jgi:hypothetical protein
MAGQGYQGLSAPLEQADPRARGCVMAGTWSNLSKQPGVSIDTMLLPGSRQSNVTVSD